MAHQKQLGSTSTLKTQGLLAALAQLKEEIPKITQTTPLPVHLDASKDIEKLLSEEAQEAIYHIVVEVMTNACRHARADNIYLRLYQQRANVITEVEDDGAGFDVAKVEARYASRGPGDPEIPDFKARAARVKGKTEIQSEPGKGTKVTVTIPIDIK